MRDFSDDVPYKTYTVYQLQELTVKQSMQEQLVTARP
jgi:hypothetical protein